MIPFVKFDPESDDVRTTKSQAALIAKLKHDRGVGDMEDAARRREEQRRALDKHGRGVLRGYPNCEAVILGVQNMPDARVRLLPVPFMPEGDATYISQRLGIDAFLELLSRSMDADVLVNHCAPPWNDFGLVLEHIRWISPSPIPSPDLERIESNAGDVFLVVYPIRSETENTVRFEYSMYSIVLRIG